MRMNLCISIYFEKKLKFQLVLFFIKEQYLFQIWIFLRFMNM